MPLLKPSQKSEKEQVRLSLNTATLAEIRAYCEWVGIEKLEDFVEQAAHWILKKDTTWQTTRTNPAKLA